MPQNLDAIVKAITGSLGKQDIAELARKLDGTQDRDEAEILRPHRVVQMREGKRRFIVKISGR